MSDKFKRFKLYDTDILDLLWSGYPDEKLLTRRNPPEDHEGVFDDLQEKELIYSIYQRNYPHTYSLLRKLDHTLSPTDAMAACLCSIGSTPKLMHTLLSHCPPIPEFQFQGVGQVSSLLNVVMELELANWLDLLLNWGADPNGGPTPDTETSPLEKGFYNISYHTYECLKRLLEAPGVNVEPTWKILRSWAHLEEDSSPEVLQCCRLLYEKITGQPADSEDLLPYPPQMTLDYTLGRGNWCLAARISGDRPITEDEKAAILDEYAEYHGVSIHNENGSDFLYHQYNNQIRLLTNFLAQYPDSLNTPELRSAVAALAVALPEADKELQSWVDRLEDGAVFLNSLPIIGYPGHPFWDELEAAFFPRWDARLGRRIVPVLRENKDLLMHNLSAEDISTILQRVTVLNDPAPANGKIPLLAMQALANAQEPILAELLQPGRALSELPVSAVLDACQTLPQPRRSFLLLQLYKETNYDL